MKILNKKYSPFLIDLKIFLSIDAINIKSKNNITNKIGLIIERDILEKPNKSKMAKTYFPSTNIENKLAKKRAKLKNK